jgi:hypothetical protein
MGTRRTPDASAKIAARHILSWRSRRGLIAVLVTCLVALMASSVSFGVGGHTPVAHASSCNGYYRQSNHWGAWFEIDGSTSCLGTPPQGVAWVQPCGASITVNADVWLSQGTTPGSNRLAESGRTGNVTYQGNCNWHLAIQLIGWGQIFTTPLYACMWALNPSNNQSFDWFCVQDS